MELTKEQIAKATLALSEEDQLEIADIICQRASSVDGLLEGERTHIEAVLTSRVDGPFISYDPTDDSFWDRIKANGMKKAQGIRAARLKKGHA